MNRRSLLKLTALLLAVLLLGGCRMEPDAPAAAQPVQPAPSQPAATPEPEAPETFGLAYAPAGGLNPYSCLDLTNRTILPLLYESLFRVDPAFTAQRQLCLNSAISGDGRTHTFRLQPDRQFSDGTAVTAADAAASIRAAMGSAFYGDRLSHVSEVTAAADDTLVVRTDTAYETLAPLLDMPIVKAATVRDAVPVGSGPYVADLAGLQLRSSSHRAGASLPTPDVISLVEATNPTRVRDEFEYGAVNLVCTDPNGNGSAAYHADFELWSSNTTTMQYLGFNLNSSLFSIVPLRKAITYALDREQLLHDGAAGFAVGTTLPISPFATGYNQRLADSYGHNPAAFHDALRSSEISDLVGSDGILDMYTRAGTQPLSGVLLVCSDSDQRVRMAQCIAQALGELGFDLTVSAQPRSAYLASLRAGSFDLYYGEVRLSPNFDLTAFFAADGALNYGGLTDPAAEELCRLTLENSGNAYDLYQSILDRGLLCPVLFKTYGVYATRGRLPALVPYLDCVFRSA